MAHRTFILESPVCLRLTLGPHVGGRGDLTSHVSDISWRLPRLASYAGPTNAWSNCWNRGPASVPA